MIPQFVSAILLAAAIAAAARYFHFLSTSGSIATFVLATTIFGFGGWQWTVPILTFFISSSVLSKLGKKRKARFQLMFEKTDTRDAGQVAANGGIAGIMMLCGHFFHGGPVWYFMYLASLAAVTADTWGTEIGLLAKHPPRSLITFKKVEAGTSGAISFGGLIGGAAGGCLIVVSGSFWWPNVTSISIPVIIIFSGLAGSFVDSLLGATLQARYRCEVCGSETEKFFHCGSPATLTGGVRWIDNDVVNWACAAAGAMFFIALSAIAL